MVSNKVLWDWDPTGVRCEIRDALARNFIKNSRDEAVTIVQKLIVNETAYAVARLIQSYFEHTHDHLTGDYVHNYYACGVYKGRSVFAHIARTSSYRYDDDDCTPGNQDDCEINSNNGAYIITISIVGPYTSILELMEDVTKSLTVCKTSIIKWWYRTSDSGTQWYNREVFLDPPKTVLHQTLYPTIGEDPHQYLKRYLESDESVLLLSGEPGTGKTSLLRHLIADFGKNADILYDESGLKSDYVFQKWLFDSTSTIMIVEDADSILKKREDHNPLMARFLNLSEGLIKFPNKKLIFTTNIINFERDVDQALVRRGRCYDTLVARPLTYEESIKACELMKWKVPEDDRDYTLAELAHNKINPEQRKVGFLP